MSKQTITRSIHPEIKVIDAAKGIVEYVASDESIDSHHELILAKGWRFTRFAKNAPFLNSHAGYDISCLLGKVVSAEVRGDQLVERVQWAVDVPSNDMAALGFAMTEAGYLKAVSVGFYAVASSYRSQPGWLDALDAAGLTAEEAEGQKLQRVFVEQEQIELSSVVIGSNPNALAKAFDDGCVSEEMLAKNGFGGDMEYDFLRKSAAAVESPDCSAALRAMIDLEMRSIYARRINNFERPPRTKPDPSAKTLDAADDVERRAADREDFLEKLDRLSK